MKKYRARSFQAVFSAFLVFSIGTSLFLSTALAQQKQPVSRTGLSPEALSAKALLEELLAKRFAQGLATQIDRSSFSVGTHLDLVEVPPVKKAPEPIPTPIPEEPLTDLSLGQFDPERLINNFTKPEDQIIAKRFLENFKIRFVEVRVGLSESLPDDTKEQVKKWLDERVQIEFGKAGKAITSPIKTVKAEDKQDPQAKEKEKEKEAEQAKKPKTFLDFLSEFQSLAGQLVMALAIMIGVLLWQILGRSAKDAGGKSMSVTMQGSGAGATDGKKDSESSDADTGKFEKTTVRDPESEWSNRTRKLQELLPHVGPRVDSIIKSWCQAGETGFLKVAVLAEAVGKEIGKLPISVDDATGVKEAFQEMTSMSVEARQVILDEVYWDFLAAINLGPESLQKPFSYLTSASTNMLKNVLIEQNPRMKTLVSLYMPDKIRSQYFRALTEEEKITILQEASRLKEIARGEIDAANTSIKGLFKPKEGGDLVSLGPTLAKMAAALSPIDEIQLLAKISGPDIESFKLEYPTLAFISDWADEPLKLLLSRATTEEIVGLCLARNDVMDRVLALSPQMTVEIVKDEVSRSKGEIGKDTEASILKLKARFQSMLKDDTLSLTTLFKPIEGAPNLAERNDESSAA